MGVWYQHTEAETKRLPFCRQQFQTDFNDWKLLLIQISQKIVPKGSIDNKTALI